MSLWLTRLPAVLASLLLFWAGVKSISLVFSSRKLTVAAAGFLAFCPYYIMAGRFALDCNLMLCFSAVSLLLLIKYIQSGKLSFLIFCGISFGITLYSYALSYFMVPIFLILITLYMLYTRKITFPRAILFAVAVCITAIPVILFACSLLFQWEPVHFLGFIIPPIASDRMSDISATGFWKNVWDIIKITLTCGSYAQDAVDKFYTLYPVSIPFIVLGLLHTIWCFAGSIRKRTFHFGSLYLLFYLSGLITIGLSGTHYIYRANSFFICYLYFWVNGIALACQFVSTYHKPFIVALSCSYLLWAASFFNYYFRIYTLADRYPNSLYSAPFNDIVDYAEENLDYTGLYLDCLRMSEYYFFYYPAAPSVVEEDGYDNGSHCYYFEVGPDTPIDPSNVYIVRKENYEFINNLNASGLAFETLEYPHYYLFTFQP